MKTDIAPALDRSRPPPRLERYTAAQRLDRLPESAFHRRMAAMIGLSLFFDGFDLYMASGINGVNAVVHTVIALLLAQALIVAMFGIQTSRRSLDTQFVGSH